MSAGGAHRSAVVRSASRQRSDTRERFEAALPFALDAFQRRALDALDAGRSVLVAAPTGSGKTLVAEYAVALALARGGKAFYTTPLKALSNQKFGDLRRAHGSDRVGLLTGDNAINGDAPVVVMTTEVLRNMIYERSRALAGLEFVVLDEVHYLQNPYRGAVWEEVIIHLDPAVRLVCLSATVSNAEEFGDWIGAVRGDTEVVIEERRPVELRHLYLAEDRERDGLVLVPTFAEREGALVPNPEALRFFDVGRRSRGRGRRFATPRRPEVIARLAADGMLPGIVFVFSRDGCERAVQECVAAGTRLTTAEERERIRDIATAHCAELSDDDLAALGFDPWLAALEAGVAAHHAGMIPPMKEAVEEAFGAGLVKVVFATETLALGINMPARSVVIERLTKFTGERHEMLTPGEYTQLTGRAGRRGIDEIGYAVVLWDRFVPFDRVASLASTRAYELTSSFRPTYNMAVNLVQRCAPDEAHRLLNLSFAQYRVDRDVVRLERMAADAAGTLDAARRLARCDRGDLDEYRRLLRALAEQRRRVGARGDLEDALARLRPGDILHAGGRIGRVVVLRKARGRGGGTWITALSTRGSTVRMGPASFRDPPRAMGRVELPSPYRPKSPEFRREVAAALRRAQVTRHAPPRRDQSLRGLEDAVRSHPVAGCPDVAEHLRRAERVHRLERDLERLERQIERRTESLGRQLDRVLEVLAARGYVQGWALTDAGRVLARLYVETDLLVAEAMRTGLLAGLDAASMAAAVSFFSYEERGAGSPGAVVGLSRGELARRWRAVESLARELEALEAGAGVPPTRPPDAGFADLAGAWARGESLDDVLGEDVSAGDFVRNVKQLVDLLRQIAGASVDPAQSAVARAAAEKLLRGVVAVSSRVPG